MCAIALKRPALGVCGHFARLFAKDVQMTPMAFLQCARIGRARQLLETTDLPLKTVAFHAGFGSVRYMRFLFSEKLGLNPTQYRATIDSARSMPAVTPPEVINRPSCR